jgi:hypothetical protein
MEWLYINKNKKGQIVAPAARPAMTSHATQTDFTLLAEQGTQTQTQTQTQAAPLEQRSHVLSRIDLCMLAFGYVAILSTRKNADKT